MRGILFFTGETGPLTDFIGGGMSHCEDRLAGLPEGFTLFSVKRRFSIPVAAARRGGPSSPCRECFSVFSHQWETELEKILITNTPAMISARPEIAAKSRCCLNATHPMAEISTMPIPDQMAYAMPTGMFFSTRLRQ